MALPGVEPVVATVVNASVGDARQFRPRRALVATTGLMPRQYLTGGKPQHGTMGPRANHCLRRQTVRGARAIA